MRSGAAIAEVTTSFLSIPLEKPLVTATFPIPAIDTALVQMRTEDGHEGVAWSFAFGRGKVASLVRLIQDLGEMAVGWDANRPGSLWANLSKAVGFLGQRGVAAAAVSAIDTACWDLHGKIAGQPLYKVLGGVRDRIEVYASQGLWLDRSRRELGDEAEKLVAEGFGAVKMRVRTCGLGRGRRARAHGTSRDRLGVKLMVDTNQAWDLNQTLLMARRLEEHGIFWLEEPMPYAHVAAYVRATPAIPMPLCTVSRTT